MERLHKRADGFTETPSGLLAISAPRPSGTDGVKAWFEFKAHVLGDVIRVEWPADSSIVLIDAETAGVMIRKGYARQLSAADVDAWNAAVDENAMRERIAAENNGINPFHVYDDMAAEAAALAAAGLTDAQDAAAGSETAAGGAEGHSAATPEAATGNPATDQPVKRGPGRPRKTPEVTTAAPIEPPTEGE